MIFLDVNTLVTSILVFIASLVILGIIVTQYRPQQTVLFSSVFYVIITVSTVYLTIMFRDTANLIRQDIIDTVASTNAYTGFVEIWVVLAVTSIGVIVGYILGIIIKYINKKNFESIWDKKR